MPWDIIDAAANTNVLAEARLVVPDCDDEPNGFCLDDGTRTCVRHEEIAKALDRYYEMGRAHQLEESA